MTTIIDKLYKVFESAEQLNEALWMNCVDSSQMSVEQLAEVVAQTTGVSISFKLVDIETDHVYGHIELYDDGKTAIVYIVKNIAPRFKRLVGTKELCQLVLDTKEDWQVDGEDTLARLVTPTVEVDADENIAVRSEQVAEILSWELLYPHELRKKELPELAKGTLTAADIAARYGIPVHVVETVLSPPRMTWADKWWAAIYRRRQQRTVAAAE